MQVDRIEYVIGDQRYVGQLATPDGDGSRPGVLVAHEGPGIDDNARNRARRITDELGYVTFALDYIGDGTPLPSLEATMERLGPLRADPLATRALGQAGLDILTACPRTETSKLAAIGHCFGGTLALELARGGAPLAAVVGFHSGLATARPEDAANITGKILVCIGADDAMIPPEQRTDFEAEMRAAGVDWQMHLYGGVVHSFTNPNADGSVRPVIKYDAGADRRSWASMVALFTEVF
jgi:dienelactone hydrolase